MFKGANDFFIPGLWLNVLSMCYNHCLDQDLFLTIQDWPSEMVGERVINNFWLVVWNNNPI